MSSSPLPSKSPLSLRQELLGRPSASVLAFAVLNAAVLSSEAAPPAPTPTPTPTPQGTDTTSQHASNASSESMTRVLVEDTLDSYKPEHANTPKRPEPLLDTPQSISIVPQKVIQDQNATSLRDILRNVPGVTLQAGEGGNTPGDNFIIRGFSARTDLYVDGVRDINGFYRDPFNIEQIEVTKGPASVYTGRGSTGGSINVITKQPGTREFFALNTGIGTDDYDRDTMDINIPFKIFGGNTDGASDGRGDDSKDGKSNAPAVASTDNAAFRLNAVWHTNDVPGRNDVSNQRWGVAPSLAFGLGTPTQLNLSYQHLEQNNQPDFGIPWVTATNVPLAPYRNDPAPVSYSNYYGLNQRDFEFLRTDELEAVLSHDFGPDLNLRDTFHVGRNYRNSIISAPRFISDASDEINREFQSRDEVDSVITNEIDLTWRVTTFGLKHIVLAGFEYTRQGFENYLRATPTTPLANLFNPDPNALFTGNDGRTGAVNYGATDDYAGYLFDTIEIGKKWQLSGGLRYDYFRQEYNLQPVTGETTTLGRIDRPLSWRGALLYKPVDIGSVYFGAGSSFNPSGEDITLTTATDKLGPEHTTAYEFGTKWDLLDRRLSLDAALFYTLKDNARTPGATAADPATVLEGEQRARGFDLELKGKLTQDWEVIGGYTYTQSKIVDSNTPAEVGNNLPGVADNTFTLWTTYDLPRGFEVGFGAQYIGERYANPINTRLADAYYTFDAMAAYHVNKHLTLRLNVYNFTDEQYIGALHTAGSYGHFFPGPRRSATLTASLMF